AVAAVACDVDFTIFEKFDLPIFTRSKGDNHNSILARMFHRIGNLRLIEPFEKSQQLAKLVRFHLANLSVSQDFPNSTARCVAASTASIRAPRTPRCSRACRPAMVVPPGLATMSLRTPGCACV